MTFFTLLSVVGISFLSLSFVLCLACTTLLGIFGVVIEDGDDPNQD
jgi:hypothetical protein